MEAEKFRSLFESFLKERLPATYDIAVPEENFETDSIAARVRTNERDPNNRWIKWYAAVSAEVYEDLPDDADAVRDLLESAGLPERMKGHGLSDTLWITTEGVRVMPLHPKYREH